MLYGRNGTGIASACVLEYLNPRMWKETCDILILNEEHENLYNPYNIYYFYV